MPNYHQTLIIGHLGHAPESRFLPSGEQVASFSVAVSESWKDKATGDKKENVTWYRVSAFGKLAAVCIQYLAKGAPVMVVGKMQCRKYVDKNGVEKEAWDLRADTMQMLGSKQADAPQAASTPADGFSDFADDVPF